MPIAELSDFIDLLQQLGPEDRASIQRLVDLLAMAPRKLQEHAAEMIGARPAPLDSESARERVNEVISYLERQGRADAG